MLLLLGALLMCGAVPIGGVVTSLTYVLTGEAARGEQTSTPAVVGVVAGLAFAALVGVLMLEIGRAGFWLEGTVVVARRALRTRRVDLATAEVTGDTVTTPLSLGNRNLTTIVSAAVRARDPRTGVTILIPVRTPGRSRLPADELTAIADAIMSRRQPGELGYPQAESLAHELRQLASAPFPI
jgi:hypothetical protein